MAELFANGKVQVKIQPNQDIIRQYSPVLKMNLSTDTLRALGWQPRKKMVEMYQSMYSAMKENRNE